MISLHGNVGPSDQFKYGGTSCKQYDGKIEFWPIVPFRKIIKDSDGNMHIGYEGCTETKLTWKEAKERLEKGEILSNGGSWFRMNPDSKDIEIQVNYIWNEDTGVYDPYWTRFVGKSIENDKWYVFSQGYDELRNRLRRCPK